MKAAHNDRCVFCDETKHLHIHHLDRNRENNDLTNLVPVCAAHHAALHAEHAHKIIRWEKHKNITHKTYFTKKHL